VFNCGYGCATTINELVHHVLAAANSRSPLVYQVVSVARQWISGSPTLQFVEMDLEGAAFENQEETTRKLLKAVAEFGTYIQRNRGFIPNYGERYRNGERISTGFVESAVNQVISKRFVKKQQMRWTPRGAHLLLQTRTKVLNGDLDDTFLSKLPNGWR
jgi:hypothetical protein